METIQALFAELTHQADINQGLQGVRQELGQLYLIDSTVISLFFSQYRWADFSKTKSGVKLHTRIRLLDENMLPDKAVMTIARKADRTQMNNWLLKKKMPSMYSTELTLITKSSIITANKISGSPAA